MLSMRQLQRATASVDCDANSGIPLEDDKHRTALWLLETDSCKAYFQRQLKCLVGLDVFGADSYSYEAGDEAAEELDGERGGGGGGVV